LADDCGCPPAGCPPGSIANATTKCSRNVDPKVCPTFLNAGVRLNETETSAKVSKVMTKNSNPMPSQLIQSGIVVEGYTSTCSEVNFVIEMNYKRLLSSFQNAVKKCNFFSA
jgi:hypothetical protein